MANRLSKDLRSIKGYEFAQRLASGIREHRQVVTWFLGAGCSISSGIPGTGGLVDRWLGELHRMQGPSAKPLGAWIREEFPKHDPANPGHSYAAVLHARHRTAAARQQEIERVCAGAEPGYGYATFAQLLSLEAEGPLCNNIPTTNFDDLIADALYLYGGRRARPQIITHEALAHYVRITSPRPLVVKLHGDAHFDPKNLGTETRSIPQGMAQHLQPLVRDSALVFVGYGGQDESVARFLQECPEPALGADVFWVGQSDPRSDVLAWLQARQAFHVDHANFDQLMHLVRGAFGIDHPDDQRWQRQRDRYLRQYEAFEKELSGPTVPAEAAELRRATEKSRASLPSESQFLLDALRAHEKPEEAVAIYRRALEAHPKSADLLGNYAVFLKNVRQDMDAAEAHYTRAIEADPKHANNLGNYAQFAFSRGHREDGLAMLRRALPRADATLLPLRVELLFYALAHSAAPMQLTVAQMKGLVGAGVRTGDWDFKSSIVRAALDGTADTGFLDDLAGVLGGKAEPEILDVYPVWRDAVAAPFDPAALGFPAEA